MTTGEQHAAEEPSSGRAARAGSILLWYALPALAVSTVIAYIAAAIILGVNPPVVPVEGASMRPTLQAGDLAFLKGVDPSTLRKGDVIAFHTPKASEAQYHLPGSLVHRITKVSHTDGQLTFQTKGDANSGPDVFTIHGGDVVGELAGHVRGLGYPILFFRSTQGQIFLGAAALMALVYFLIGLFEERHEYVAGTTLGLQAILDQTDELKRLIERVEPVAGERGEADARANAPPPPPPIPLEPPITQLTDEVRSSRELNRQNSETIRELVVAIGEYGEHLRSHTAIMQGLAATTSNLEQATGELAAAVAKPGGERPGADAETGMATSTGRPTSGPLTTAAEPYTRLALLPSRRPQMLMNVLSELRSPSLTRSLRGYAVEPVERLLAQAATALEDMLSDREQLHSRLEAAEQQLAHYRELEAEMTQALLAAERNARELTEQLQRQTERVLEEVQAGAREIVEQAVKEALGDRRSLPAARAGGGSPPPEDHSLRGMLTRARAGWRAAMAQPQASPPPAAEDPHTRS